MNRKQMVEFLNGLKNGTRKLSELIANTDSELMVFIQHEENKFVGNKGKTCTKEEIDKLPGAKVIIENPHLKSR